jgi:hypothetical protein
MTRLIDLAGRRFGKLVVLRRDGSLAPRVPAWRVRCDCGKEKLVNGSNLRRGDTRSCGCVQTRHGMFGTPEYSAWCSMVRRCCNPRTEHFELYGGRGIAVCQAWRNDFVAFFRDMGTRPSPKHSLDRIDSNGNYEPSNCRWATTVVQSRNRRCVRLVTVDGVTRPMPEWAELAGLSKNAIRERLRRGWSVRDAVTRKASKTETAA